ncbi:MAG: hypothetical protein QME27_04035 [Syntrophaceae bacterium]|nr:hypothetical protein [Syntrophaceae bacterium]
MGNKSGPLTDVTVKLIGEDGNAFAIIGKVSRALRKAGYDDAFVREYEEKAISGDYDNLLMVTMTYVDVA